MNVTKSYLRRGLMNALTKLDQDSMSQKHMDELAIGLYGADVEVEDSGDEKKDGDSEYDLVGAIKKRKREYAKTMMERKIEHERQLELEATNCLKFFVHDVETNPMFLCEGWERSYQSVGLEDIIKRMEEKRPELNGAFEIQGVVIKVKREFADKLEP
jgi:hypothetical protein